MSEEHKPPDGMGHAATMGARAGTGPAADGELINQTIAGRYRIIELLGAGGMGSVYRAEHVAIGKPVAVKVIHPRLGDSKEALARFRREGFAGGRIGHPNCVGVTDFGVLDDGSLYLVMELLHGESLSAVIKREGQLPWPRALRIARHVLRGLGHAHEHGIVHRDIKPDNVIVSRRDDDPEFAQILDFGIAKLVGDAAASITQEGIAVGTPAYLAPEQAHGGVVDGTSDLYSLSVVLYEMLTGRTPFGDRDMLGMLTAHIVAEVPPMSEIAPEAAIPEPVEALVRAGLAKLTADRVPSAAEYVARIDALLAATARPSAALPVAVSTVYPATSATLTTARVPKLPAAWQRAAVMVGGGILVVGILAAIATRCSESPRTKASLAPDAATPAPEATPPPPIVTPPVFRPEQPVADVDQLLAAALHDLQKGKTCEARKTAVERLRVLGDKRAIAPLKKARYRMRGGVLGVGDRNTNSCLKEAAAKAAAELAAAP